MFVRRDRARLVERAGGNVDLIGMRVALPQKRRAAGAAEAAHRGVGGAPDGRGTLGPLELLHRERRPGHDRSAAAALAHAAVAVVDVDRLALGAIAHGAAE